jgi:hypothetical protein
MSDEVYYAMGQGILHSEARQNDFIFADFMLNVFDSGYH